MSRFLIAVYLKSFVAKNISEVAGEGEFYFKCNRRRFPSYGTIHLKKLEELRIEPMPLMYLAIVESRKTKFKFNISAREDDPVVDDLMIERTFEVPVKPLAQDFEMFDKTKLCALYIHIRIEETRQY